MNTVPKGIDYLASFLGSEEDKDTYKKIADSLFYKLRRRPTTEAASVAREQRERAKRVHRRTTPRTCKHDAAEDGDKHVPDSECPGGGLFSMSKCSGSVKCMTVP